MTMEHKAYVFDYQAFEVQLGASLYEALLANNVTALADFITRNVGVLKDPLEGQPLTASWEELLEQRDVQEYGDIALTKFYDPGNNIGLRYNWQKAQDALSKYLKGRLSPVLGSPLGPPNNYFDPGRMGTYFQSPKQVETNLSLLESVAQQELNVLTTVDAVRRMLKLAVDVDRGLYVTF